MNDTGCSKPGTFIPSPSSSPAQNLIYVRAQAEPSWEIPLPFSSEPSSAFKPEPSLALILKGHQVFLLVRSKVVLFMFRKECLQIFFFVSMFFLVLTSRTCFRFNEFKKKLYKKNEDVLSSTRYLLRLYLYQ